jgi:4-hydroxybenzoate polyprenyltransferase
MSSSPILHGDIPAETWLDRRLPASWRPYSRLMRLDRPIGTWLLLFPCWWSAAMAAEGWPNLWLFALFAVGAVVMRGAGCTVNDWADRDFDGKVARTAARPIPSGAVSPRQALLFLVAQLLVGLLVLLQLNWFAIGVGAASLLLVFPYPFMKRITYWPQAWLGLTFNWWALVGWAAVRGDLTLAPVLLYIAGVFWTLGYDTIYAHQDKEDDILIGVKSTALALAENTVTALWIFYGLALILIAAAGWSAGLAWPFWPLLAVAAMHLAWQALRVDINDSSDCLAKFKSNRHFGWLLLLAIVVGRVW